MYYAHSRNDHGERQELIAHLTNVAEMASRFANPFEASQLARLLGLWHDLGKFNPLFQEYLLACETNPTARGHGPDHKAAGAHFALQYVELAALLIQGHHGGLKSPTAVKTWLQDRRTDPAVADALQRAQQTMPGLELGSGITLPEHILRDPVAAELFLRMLFSALVDADFLDTEMHFNAERATPRGTRVTMGDLWELFVHDQQRFANPRSDTVSQTRHAIYRACLEAANHSSGIFRLAVPTGGGKTRSAMAFALQHALRHGHQRIIVAVPFISITEQTANVYRSIFEVGREDSAHPIVLEHHSNALDTPARNGTTEEEGDFHPRALWSRLAAENWDAPVVVTTTVQLFESLFANGTSRCRKLHSLAHSVIILDEAQALPGHLLTPILNALRALCTHYGATVVISTATQPAFDTIPAFAAVSAMEIVPDPGRFFEVLRRVEYEWRTDPAHSWAEIAEMMRAVPSALAILNTKKGALALLDALGDPDALHLSTLLCGAHRRRVLDEVQRRLKGNQPCRLVSTQVVEAGVDLDFPVVLRALGPLDSIIQAAGRCNREGLLSRGRVIVFRPAEDSLPPGIYRTAAGITGALLGGKEMDPDNPETSRAYFQQLYQTIDTDRESIQTWRAQLNYPEVALRFRMIDDDAESVAVNYGSLEEQSRTHRLLERLRGGTPQARSLLRRLQPYLVSIRAREAERYRKLGWISPVIPGVGEWMGGYDSVRGLVGADPNPDAWVV